MSSREQGRKNPQITYFPQALYFLKFRCRANKSRIKVSKSRIKVNKSRD
jgi:hypothetical protein